MVNRFKSYLPSPTLRVFPPGSHSNKQAAYFAYLEEVCIVKHCDLFDRSSI